MPGTITDTSCDIDLRLKCCFWGGYIFPFHLLSSVIYKTSDTSREMFLENDCLLFVPLVFSGTLCQKSLQKSLSTLSTRASVTCQYTRNVDLDIGCWSECGRECLSGCLRGPGDRSSWDKPQYPCNSECTRGSSRKWMDGQQWQEVAFCPKMIAMDRSVKLQMVLR